ncbi:FMN-dependent NADH-azoreductase [Pseudovibrio ascidiaceicola]|uniref:FMN dependent NADH:quinone oxidoreductase n=1 Tax=Pseudovibrio ascidiaceicola TaxID=285279 RepID=A0A1I3WKZ6_9HYPH|nr:NAD(P)H-dependent oxidoreductase [Pseudovibrio ascidiaceicola]SFK07833.1 FMN-dependent NADH-azoreductase [Pseudovibrio ascidiaceicola]
MTTLLQIDASIRGSESIVPEYNSISRSISATFMKEWQQHKPNDTVICRDVGMHPPDHITQDWIAAVFTAPESRSDTQNALLAQSDSLIAELEQADIIVLSTPMYNYGMPAGLKAWFDQVIRINKTFSFDLKRGDYPLEPILFGKKLVAITSSGEFGFGPGGIRESWNHLMPHIRTLKGYLGVDELFEVTAEYQEFNDKRHKTSVQDAHAKARDLAAKLALLD